MVKTSFFMKKKFNSSLEGSEYSKRDTYQLFISQYPLKCEYKTHSLYLDKSKVLYPGCTTDIKHILYFFLTKHL